MITTKTGTKTFPDDLPAPYEVPINSSIQIKLQWIDGFLTSRSFITIIHINDDMIQKIQLLLTTLGIYSYIEKSTPTKVPLPDNKNILISNFGLLIPWAEFFKLKELGFETKINVPEEYEMESSLDLFVSEVIDIGRISPTYSFIEEKNNAGIFNGILTGQCLEII